MRELLGVAAIGAAFSLASSAAAQSAPTLKVIYILCEPDAITEPDGTRTVFYHNAAISNGKLTGLAAMETRIPGKLTFAADTPIKSGTARLTDAYKIAYPQETKPQFARELLLRFPAADGVGLKGPFVLSYFSGGNLIHQGKPRVYASGELKLAESIPDAVFVRLKGSVKVTLDAEGSARRIAEIEFIVPQLGTRGLYESNFKPINVPAVEAGNIPTGCRRG